MSLPKNLILAWREWQKISDLQFSKKSSLSNPLLAEVVAELDSLDLKLSVLGLETALETPNECIAIASELFDKINQVVSDLDSQTITEVEKRECMKYIEPTKQLLAEMMQLPRAD